MDSRYICLCLVLQLAVYTSAFTDTDYIDDFCGSTITVSQAVRLKLLSYSWPSDATCTVNIKGSSLYHFDSNTRIIARFRSISLSAGLAGTCSKSRVDLFDSDGTYLTDSSGTCGYLVPYPRYYKSSGNTLTIKFKQLSTISSGGTFEILLTQFTTGICNTMEFDCLNGRCIDDSLTCDSYDNCGDDSDELSGCYYYTWGTGSTAGISVGVIFFIIFVGALSAGVYRRRTYGYVWRSSVPYNQGISTVTSTTSTVVAPPPYVPSTGPPPTYAPSPYPQY